MRREHDLGVPMFSSNATPQGLPEDLKDIVSKLQKYGFQLYHFPDGIWELKYPPGDPSGFNQVSFFDQDLATGLLSVLRAEEQAGGDLVRYEQFDKRWGQVVYGTSRMLKNPTLDAGSA